MAELWTPGGSFDVPTDGQLSEQEKLSRLASFALNRGRAEGPGDDSADRREMKLNRRANRGSGISKSGSLYSGQSQMSFATGRPQDPLFYWKQNNLPFDVWKDDELVALRHYMRLIYLTHPVMASAIDIFSRLPLTGLELRCKDESLVEFHTTLFLEDLNYEEYLSDILHEYFLVGEAWPLGQFNETLGVWEDDELINPDDVKVIKSPFLKEPRFEMKLPEALRTILQKREPEWEYRKLVQSYPELLHFATNEAYMPVSNVLLKQIKFKCIVGPTQVTTPYGLVSASSLRVGDEVVSWDLDTDTSVIRRVSYTAINPPEPIWWVETLHGRKIGVTADHPFLTPDGWMEASALVKGTRLRVDSDHPSALESVDQDVARFLGIMAGDGTCGSKRSNTTKIHNVDSEVLDWVSNFVAGYGCHLTPEAGGVKSWLITQGPSATKANPNLIRRLLKEHGMYGQNTYTKRVPASVWGGGPKVWSMFLAGYFDTDGYFEKNEWYASWASVNRLLLEDCQSLLAFLGIPSRLSYIWQTNSYRLIVTQYYIGTLGEYLDILIPRKQLGPREHANRSLTQYQAQEIRNRLTVGELGKDLAVEYGITGTTISNIKKNRFYKDRTDIIWDVVKRVVVGEDESTIALGIEGEHNHVTAGLVTHNSDTFHPRGIPLMMRAMRAITQEEMLNSAQDAIASRLYTPLILARLGASATDLGTTVPWIPTSDDLMNFEEALDAALAADFRVLTHHFALQMDSVFGRETMPDFGPDFDRLVGRQLQAFGMSETMLSGAGEGETYAADAINKDIMSQLLRYAQRLVKRFCKDRMMIVAEAQGHYDYEERGGKKYPILEDVLEVDEETGEQTIVQQPKLLVPDIYLREMDLADEQAFQQLMEALRATGVPISMKTRLTNVPIDLDDEIERTHEEQVNLAVEAEKVRKDTYMQLNLLGLPIPEDLEADFRPSALDAPAPSADMGLPLPSLGMDDPASTAALAPTEQDYMQGDDSQEPSGTPGAPPGAAGAVIMPMPTAPPSRPPESDEQRGSMPKPRRSAKIQPKDSPPADDQIEEGRYRLMSGPRLASARPKLDPDIPFDEQDEQGTGTSRAPDSIQS